MKMNLKVVSVLVLFKNQSLFFFTMLLYFQRKKKKEKVKIIVAQAQLCIVFIKMQKPSAGSGSARLGPPSVCTFQPKNTIFLLLKQDSKAECLNCGH